jgi:hypothetical protein
VENCADSGAGGGQKDEHGVRTTAGRAMQGVGMTAGRNEEQEVRTVTGCAGGEDGDQF